MHCPLCSGHELSPIGFSDGTENYFKCETCSLRFLKEELRLDPDEEKARYMQHQNDINDPRYKDFVMPLVSQLKKHIKKGDVGLDFGAGRGPIIAHLLGLDGYKVNLYDPYFWPDSSVLDQTYDFIFACEVIEHVYAPEKELKSLLKLLHSGGVLALMTSLVTTEIDFENWYYRRDPTHVCFYSEETIKWMTHHFGFSRYEIVDQRVISLYS